MELNVILLGDVLEQLRKLPTESVHCVVTSPPYWGLRDYGVEGQLGLEKTPGEFVQKMVDVFREVKRVLRKDGTLWLNLGDSYASNWGMGAKRKSSWWSSASGELEGKGWGNIETAIPPNSFHKRRNDGLKVKDLIGIPWRVAFALQADGWYLRSDIIWHKPNPMPESITDRPTRSHEYIFLLTKSQKYYYDGEAIKEPAVSNHPSGNGYKREERKSFDGRGNIEQWQPSETRNKRDVWTVAVKPFKEAHFAVYPVELIRPCVLAGCPAEGVVLDPFMGSGTTALVALQHGRKFLGCELNPEYIKIALERLRPYLEQKKLEVYAE